MNDMVIWDSVGTWCGGVFVWYAIMQAHRMSYRTLPPLVLAIDLVAVGGLALFLVSIPDLIWSVLPAGDAVEKFLIRVHGWEHWARPLGYSLISMGFALKCIFERRRNGHPPRGRLPA